MTATVQNFIATLQSMGSTVLYHRESSGDACPCKTPEGFRDPSWHRENPLAPVCNEQGYLAATITQFTVKAAIQPVLARSFRRPSERADDLFGDVQTDDHIGIFPYSWSGNVLDFQDWNESGSDYIEYDGRRFTVISSDKIPDIDGDPNHHYEVGLRLLTGDRPSG